MSVAYQRIILESTLELGNDYEAIERERSIVDNILKENSIDYLILLEETPRISERGRYVSHEFILSVFVKMIDVDKVIELFDQDGTLGYYVDLDEKIVLDVPLSEEAIKEAEEKLKQEEFEETMQKESIEEDFSEPIKNELDEDTEDDEESSETIEVTLTNLFIIVIFSLMFMTIISIELSSIIAHLKKGDYSVALKVILVILVEIPIFIKILKNFSIKKGK